MAPESYQPVPLAERLRPKKLSQFIGQKHLLGQGKPIRQLLRSGKINSIIFWGPPGTGKTTLAHLLADQLDARFVPFSAVTSGLPELRSVITQAEQSARLHEQTVVFIDEIHRWNKAQQDALLPHVERGTITLIGATTENPSFEVNGALLSRAHVYQLQPLSQLELGAILKQALVHRDAGLSEVVIEPEAKRFLIEAADGDARTLLNMLELAKTTSTKRISVNVLQDVLARKALRYDKKGEDHYNTISAFIKSMRGSDADAAVYYLARMLEAGEDPLFVARRMVVFASEDIGNADPHALLVAVAAFDAARYIGMPECRINLAQAATYLAAAPKSNASYRAIEDAWREVRASGSLPVPLHLRNAPTKLMKQEGYGRGYQYAHGQADQFVSHHHLPDQLAETVYYDPSERGHEAKIKEKLDLLRRKRASQAAKRRPKKR